MLNKWIICLFLFTSNAYESYGFHVYRKIPFLSNLQTCTSKVCELDAHRILNALNISVDPCEDFYEFACGNWATHNIRPSYLSTWSHWEPALNIVQKQIQSILEDDKIETEFAPVNAAKKLYETCIDAEYYEEENLMVLYKFLNEFGGWPMISNKLIGIEDWFVTVTKINSMINVYPLIKFHVSTDLYNTSKNILYIDHPSLVFPQSILSDPFTYKTHINIYEKWIVQCAQELLKLSHEPFSVKTLKRDAHEIVQFEMQLANLMSTNEDETNLKQLFKLMTLEHLQLWTDLIPLNNGNSISWNNVINVLFKNTKQDINYDGFIVMRNPKYLIKLIKLIDRTPKRTIANYLGWLIVKHFIKETTRKMKLASFEIDKLLLGIQHDVHRKEECISLVTEQMGLVIGYQYINKFFDIETKKDAEDMLENIRHTLIIKLKSLEWLDEVTKSKAIDKAQSITNLVGYPDWMQNTSYIDSYYKNLKLSRNHLSNILFWNEFTRTKELSKLYEEVDNNKWLRLPTEVNAYYNVLQNAIILPAALLQYPFFHTKRLKEMNYAAIGTIMGHEISHTFDNTGRQADKNGNIKQWWTKESLEKYYENIKCFQELYDQYSIKTIERITKNKIKINGRQTQDENIADVMGLELAYYTYRNIKSDSWKLPGLEKLTSDQYFFLNFANLWCESMTNERLLSEVLDGDHTPSKLRVLGALSNSEEFNKAFKCPENSMMNSKHKCKLW